MKKTRTWNPVPLHDEGEEYERPISLTDLASSGPCVISGPVKKRKPARLTRECKTDGCSKRISSNNKSGYCTVCRPPYQGVNKRTAQSKPTPKVAPERLPYLIACEYTLNSSDKARFLNGHALRGINLPMQALVYLLKNDVFLEEWKINARLHEVSWTTVKELEKGAEELMRIDSRLKDLIRRVRLRY